MSYLVSWSGGKDSCFACYKAICKGYAISYLINFISKDLKKVSFHGIEAKLIQAQAKAISIPLLQKETTWSEYEQDFKNTVKSLTFSGIKGMIFGDIYIQEHKEWVERVCKELGIEAIEPLWGKEPKKVLLEFINEGFEAIIVSVDSSLFDKEWVSQKIDKKFLKYLEENKIDFCGESGEYHTFVIDGPIFKERIKITKSNPVMLNNRWFLDILKYSLVSKSSRIYRAKFENLTILG
ncbi:MAG: diphthine--ammonia ligase [Candidatus Bathyarchaeia archaeon]